MLYKAIFFLPLLFLSACASRQHTTLAKVHLISTKGTRETITHKERLKKYIQEKELLNQPYRKVIRIYNIPGATQSVITTYHSNNQIYQRLECVDGQACGAYSEWFPNGQLKVEAKILKGVPDTEDNAQQTWAFHGISRAYDNQGNITAVFQYMDGQLQGESKEFYSSGSLRQTSNFVNGKIHGTLTGYDPEGNLIKELHYYHGLLDGTSKQYWKKGRLCFEERFNNGQLQTGVYFNALGALVGQVQEGDGFRANFESDGSYQLVQYKRGKESGNVKVYNHKNQLLNTFSQKDEVKRGLETLYYPESQRPKLSIDWSDGKVHGLVKTWYENGQMESQKEMSLNKKHGISTAWYLEGGLMFVEEYDQDRLIKGKYFKKGKTIPASVVQSGDGLATLFDERGIFIRKVEYSGGKPVE